MRRASAKPDNAIKSNRCGPQEDSAHLRVQPLTRVNDGGDALQQTLSALIFSFSDEHGFGWLELEDGRELRFDVTACLAMPSEGQTVRVVVGGGQHAARVVRVEPADQPDSQRPVTTAREAIRRLQAEGLMLEQLTSDVEVFSRGRPDEPRVAEELIRAYYTDAEVGPARAVADRFVPLDGLVDRREVRRLLDQPDPTPSSWPPGPMASALDIIDAENARLARLGDRRRVVVVPGVRGAFVMALSRAQRLAAIGALAVDLSRPHLSPTLPA